jgi:hypothetical protein
LNPRQTKRPTSCSILLSPNESHEPSYRPTHSPLCVGSRVDSRVDPTVRAVYGDDTVVSAECVDLVPIGRVDGRVGVQECVLVRMCRHRRTTCHSPRNTGSPSCAASTEPTAAGPGTSKGTRRWCLSTVGVGNTCAAPLVI